MSATRAKLINLAVVLISVLIAIIIAEAGARIFMDNPMYSRFLPSEDKEGIVSEGVPDAGFYENTPLGKRLKVNANGIVRKHGLTGTDIPLRTNDLGFRGPPIEYDSRPRVLFLGDSITLGDYLVEENTFVARVGEMSKDTDRPLQTINAGVGSIGIEEELNILRETGHIVEPQIVVLDLYLNDIQASPALNLIPIPKLLRWSQIAQHYYQYKSVKQYENDPNKTTWIPREVEDSWKAQAAQKYPPVEGGDWHTDRGAYNKMMVDWFGDWGSSYSDGGQARILSFADEIVAVSKSLGAMPMIVIHPTIFQVETVYNPNEAQLAFVEHFNSTGVPVLDLLPIMRSKYAADGRRLFYDHCHHNIEGAQLVAQQIYPFIINAIKEHGAEYGI